MRKHINNKGFGFIEVLIVLLIIGGLIYYIYLKPTEEGVREAQKVVNDTEDRVQENLNLGALRTQIKMYHMENGKYPDSLEDIAQAKTFQATGLDISRYNYDPATGEVSLRR
jgi:prepilin-type N-terminal cleavage/methylation domain-containing protein